MDGRRSAATDRSSSRYRPVGRTPHSKRPHRCRTGLVSKADNRLTVGLCRFLVVLEDVHWHLLSPDDSARQLHAEIGHVPALLHCRDVRGSLLVHNA